MKPCMRQDLLGQIFVLGHSVDLCMCKNRIAPVRLCGGEVCAVKKTPCAWRCLKQFLSIADDQITRSGIEHDVEGLRRRSERDTAEVSQISQ